MGYRVIEYPYEYEGKRYIGYVLVKPYWMFGIYGYDRVTHFTDINSLNVFIGDDLIIDSFGWLNCLTYLCILMDLMDLNEYPNVYSKTGEATTWLPELQQPAEIIGRLDTHYPDVF